MLEIKKLIEKIFGLDLSNPSRKYKYVRARACYYVMARHYTASGYEQIGESVNKNHATVIHGQREFKEMCRVDKDLEEKYLLAKSQLFTEEPKLTLHQLLNQYNRLVLHNITKDTLIKELKEKLAKYERKRKKKI